MQDGQVQAEEGMLHPVLWSWPITHFVLSPGQVILSHYNIRGHTCAQLGKTPQWQRSLKPQSYSICLNTEVTVRDNGHANNFIYDAKKMWPTSSVYSCLLGVHNYIIAHVATCLKWHKACVPLGNRCRYLSVWLSMYGLKKGIQSHTCLLQFAPRRGEAQQAFSVYVRLCTWTWWPHIHRTTRYRSLNTAPCFTCKLWYCIHPSTHFLSLFFYTFWLFQDNPTLVTLTDWW